MHTWGAKSVIWRKGEWKKMGKEKRREKCHMCIVVPVNFKASSWHFVHVRSLSSFPCISRQERERKRERKWKCERHLARRTQEIGIIPRRKCIPRRNYCVASAIFHENTPGRMYKQARFVHTQVEPSQRPRVWKFSSRWADKRKARKFPRADCRYLYASRITIRVLFKNCSFSRMRVSCYEVFP